MKCAIYTTLLIFILFGNLLVAQTDERKILLTGVVVTGENLTPLPYTNIIIINENTGTTTNEKGYFSFKANKNDTIIFSSVGFKDGRYVIPENLTGSHYSIVQIMTNDTVYLRETIIYPWKTYEEFGKELVTMHPPPTDNERAKNNLEQAQLYERYTNIYMDGEANYKYQQQLYSEKAYFGGQVPPFEIFNAFAWIEFVNSWKRGDYKKKN